MNEKYYYSIIIEIIINRVKGKAANSHKFIIDRLRNISDIRDIVPGVSIQINCTCTLCTNNFFYGTCSLFYFMFYVLCYFLS